MNRTLTFASLNDFIFCPASIYFHGMYEGVEGLLFKDVPQVAGSHAHKEIDLGILYSKDVISSLFVYSQKYDVCGKIDKYFVKEKRLVECKKHINKVYDGYIYQLYCQYFGMIEAGFEVKELYCYSIDDNKKYKVALPLEDSEMLYAFEETLRSIHTFSLERFSQNNIEKCKNCIYSNICAWGIADDE